ncbi:DUF3592 domain-containing protein [Williamsia phyllosphaerae]|uniref:DUF3592 domain-containing protein n=1 Tax=Williamsia phyllosphaerae TaxID=885042 RepID=A0ABQ1UP59_9NOCA|nr:DUF3592 domain-containing protein [Williamsia phyllosphaerae]GGF23118.1 hypothetical protein GCM10007298_18830 [Williamsia phyllosphaerae]
MSPTHLRRTQIGLLIVAGIVTIMMAVMVAGCYRDDASIEDNLATATADVVTAGSTKSTVRFYTPDGQVRSPRLGIFYPTELAVGQRISVEYDSSNPDLVRVAGRDASLSIIPAVSIAGYTWLFVIAVMVLLAEVSRRRRVDPTDTPAATSDATAPA